MHFVVAITKVVCTNCGPDTAGTVISAAGLLFAAIAAGGAWMTVRLTRQIRREDDIRRLTDALVGIEHVAEEIKRVGTASARFNLQDRFRAAVYQLDRAMKVSGKTVLADGEVHDSIERLRMAAWSDDHETTIENARRAEQMLLKLSA